MSTRSPQPRSTERMSAGLLWWWPAIVVTAVLAAAFTIVIRNNELLAGERTLTRWFSDLDVAGVRLVVDVLDFVSDDAVAPVVFVLILLVVLLAWGRYAALTYLVTGGLTGLTRITDLASRPRPTEDFQWTEAVFGAGGYPSGHVIYAVLVFGTLAYLAGRYMSPGRTRTAFQVFLVFVVVTMGPARLINLDHWAMDVIGSYLLALPFLLGALWLHPRLPGWMICVPRLRTLIGADRAL